MFQRFRMPAPASSAATTVVPAVSAADQAAATTTPVDRAADPAQIPATPATDEAGRAFA
ncbi:hypothetical protein ACGF13_17800 [Kitasatospora sp. NPDC048286]|uniref:hypothetical protein n=1 Tax=unclassified Kitasatospora TaxID=2633591 RepID=UPI0037240422